MRSAAVQGFAAGESGSVTLEQRFGGSVNLNVHFHTLLIEGVYREEAGRAVYHPLAAPSNEDVRQVLEQIQKGVVKLLVRKGYALERKPESY